MAQCQRIMLGNNLLILIFLFGILVLFCPLSCQCLSLTHLDLWGMEASQVSSYRNLTTVLTADLAIDGDTRTNVHDFTCSHTEVSSHPWWKVDLSTNHCLGRITLVNRADCCNDRLSGAIVRAGTESDIFKNAVCGLPVTSHQASIPGEHIPILCDPPVIARYVSVDDEVHLYGSGDGTLTLCEVMVEEFPLEDCHQTTTIGMSTVMFEGKIKCVDDPSPLKAVHLKSLMQCFVSCKMNNECLSFDYDIITGQCKLYDVKIGNLKADDQAGCFVYGVVRD